MAPLLEIRFPDRKVFSGEQLLPSSPKLFAFWCLLAFRLRHRSQSQNRSIGLEEVLGLVSWSANNATSAGHEISRLIGRLNKLGLPLIRAAQKTNGPFSLALKRNQITTDWPQLERLLQSKKPDSEIDSPEAEEHLYRFSEKLWRGEYEFTRGMTARSLKLFEAAKQQAKLPEQQALVACKQARVFRTRDDHVRALDVLEEALQSAPKGSYRIWSQSKLRATKAWVLMRQNRLPESAKLYRRVIDDLEGSDAFQLIGDAYNGLGLIQRRRGQYEESLRSHHRAIYAFSLAEYHYGLQGAYFNIGNVYSVWADHLLNAGKRAEAAPYLAHAETWIKRCMSLCDAFAIADDESDDRILLAHIYRQQGNLSGAEIAAQEALRFALTAENWRCAAQAFREIAHVQIAKGEIPAARETIAQARRSLPAPGLKRLREKSLAHELDLKSKTS